MFKKLHDKVFNIKKIDDRQGEPAIVSTKYNRFTDKVKKEIIVLYHALKHPKTPWWTKILLAVVVGYALSPFDLIPDFIPVLGYVDDFLLFVVGAAIAGLFIPKNVLEECRQKVETDPPRVTPKLWIMGILVISVWIILLALIIYWIIHLFWK